MAGLIRRAQSAQLMSSKKKKKMAAEWETVAQNENEAAFNNEVMEIMRGLVANPSKLGAVKVASYGVDTTEEDERRKRFFSEYMRLLVEGSEGPSSQQHAPDAKFAPHSRFALEVVQEGSHRRQKDLVPRLRHPC